MYDIIQTLVCNFGNEPISNIYINDVPVYNKFSVRNASANRLYCNISNKQYTYNTPANLNDYYSFEYNQTCGYVYDKLVYPGELVSSIGDNICSVLDRIIEILGNHEYYYDVNGKFVFQEKKNYLNNTYVPAEQLDRYGSVLNENNFKVSFCDNSKSVYTFEEDCGLITSINNTPDYGNIKNDFHIWGKHNDNTLHYHCVIKEKPQPELRNGKYSFRERQVVLVLDDNGLPTGRIRLPKNSSESTVSYVPNDWRAELYLQGLECQLAGIRPDIYQQEILDLFDGIYNMQKKQYKTGSTNDLNDLNYWIDYIEPIDELFGISVDNIGTKIYSYQKDQVIQLFNHDVLNILMLDNSIGEKANEMWKKMADEEGLSTSQVEHSIMKNVAEGLAGYSAFEVARELLYQYTNYNASITINCVPIYYLEPNTRITVNDKLTSVSGDYIIKSINLPLDMNGTMSIQATRALERK